MMAVAISAGDVVTYGAVHSFLERRLDEEIGVAQDQLVAYIRHSYSEAVNSGSTTAKQDPAAWLSGITDTPPAHASTHKSYFDDHAGLRSLSQQALSSHVAPDDYVEVIDSDGSVVFVHSIGPVEAATPAPDLPANLRPAAIRSQGGRHTYPPDRPGFEVGSIGSPSTQYLVEVVSVPGGVLVTAAPEAPTASTLSSLVHIEILVSLVVMLVLAVLVAWTVRLGLRPLEDMTDTAGAFAKGDLSKRIRFTDERTEVGRLGRALNGMLVQIESAFSKREESDVRLRRFVADASHDLRTPLTSIRGYAELLRKGAFTLESDRRRALGRIEHEAERMAALVDDLLLLARLDQGRPVAHDPVELGALVSDAVAAVRVVDPARPITVDAPAEIVVRGDEGRLRQAVDNLLRNAVVHTPAETPVSVRVSTGRERARVSVADKGPGLAPEERERVFDRFFQADPARTGQGTGLGLSIVAAIAEAHGGHAWVDSSPGEGATFYFDMPMDTTADAPVDQAGEEGTRAPKGNVEGVRDTAGEGGPAGGASPAVGARAGR